MYSNCHISSHFLIFLSKMLSLFCIWIKSFISYQTQLVHLYFRIFFNFSIFFFCCIWFSSVYCCRIIQNSWSWKLQLLKINRSKNYSYHPIRSIFFWKVQCRKRKKNLINSIAISSEYGLRKSERKTNIDLNYQNI